MLPDIFAAVVGSIQPQDQALLIGIDSVNTFADMLCASDSRLGYFDALSRIFGYLITVRRLTEGRVRAILVSELNQRGQIKGAKLEYAADLALRVTHGELRGYVDVECSKGREGGFGPVGNYFVDWRHGRFKGPEEPNA